MSEDLSLATLTIMAASKIILALGLLALVWFFRQRRHPIYFTAVAASMIGSFTLMILWPLQKMWWGNNGDEMFVGAYFTQIIQGSMWQDYYYHWLPPFYPPLYFWSFGMIGRLLALSSITTAKLGIMASVVGIFIVPIIFYRSYRLLAEERADEIASSPWYWLVVPVLFIGLIDFDTVLVKPYEVLPALLSVLWLGIFANAIMKSRWRTYDYLWFGLSGGILFLWFYFWWFILAPVVLLLAVSAKKRSALWRAFGALAMIGAVSLPYTAPLIVSFWRFGIESWQASYFVPTDFSTFTPWVTLSWRLPWLVGGLFTLVWFWQRPFMRGLAIGLICAYLYQLVNIVIFLTGGSPAQSAKPFLFFGTAILAAAAGYGLIALNNNLSNRFFSQSLTKLGLVVALLFLPLTPFIRFIDDPVIWRQIDIDRKASPAKELSESIAKAAPQYSEIVWLTSGAPELNLYLPLNYYIAYNPHFSHPAVGYSSRLKLIGQLSQANSVDEFQKLIDAAEPPITGLLLYFDRANQTYPIFFWQDNFPNGGKESRFDIKPAVIGTAYWREVSHQDDWHLFVRNEPIN